MEATVAQLLLAVLSGGIVALLLTVFGGGGSVLAVPLLLYVVGVQDPHVAIGASAAGVALNALTALTGQARAGRVRWPCALLFAGTGSVGAFVGSSVAKAIDGHALLIFFAVAMGLVALAMLRPNAPVGAGNVRLTRAMAPRIAASGAGVGVAAFFCFMFSWVELLLARTLTSVNAKPIVATMTRTVSASGMDWATLAAAGTLTIVPGAIVIWFVRHYIAKGFAMGRV